MSRKTAKNAKNQRNSSEKSQNPSRDRNARSATRDELEREIAGPTFAGVRPNYQPSISTNLTPERLASVIAAADSGDHRDLMTLAMEMEEREPHLRSMLQTRKMAILGLTMHVEPYSERLRDRKIADEITHLINDNCFSCVITDMMDAIMKGFSVIEMEWDTESRPWKPIKYTWQNPYYFKYDEKIYRELLLVDDENAMGVELPEGKFIIHRSGLQSGPIHRAGMAKSIAPFYIAKSYSIKAWINFSQIYGIPLRIGRHAPNATEDERSRLLAAIRGLGSNASAVMPTTMTIETEDGVSGSHGASVFSSLIDYIDGQVSKAVVGQTMTSDAGGSFAQAKIHEIVRQDILWADAQDIARTINQQLIRTYLRLNYGASAASTPPRLKFTQDEKSDLAVFTQSIIPFIDRGLKVSMKEVAQKFGISDPESVEDPITSLEAKQLGNPATPQDIGPRGGLSND